MTKIFTLQVKIVSYTAFYYVFILIKKKKKKIMEKNDLFISSISLERSQFLLKFWRYSVYQLTKSMIDDMRRLIDASGTLLEQN